ncbi:hypothetical protein T484DRAFT_1933691 [Baffinella frigidus]|nr:hypothetical protein T484DRAFT_1933691 [Cryptophyta sp. CCMP2293]
MRCTVPRVGEPGPAPGHAPSGETATAISTSEEMVHPSILAQSARSPGLRLSACIFEDLLSAA